MGNDVTITPSNIQHLQNILTVGLKVAQAVAQLTGNPVPAAILSGLEKLMNNQAAMQLVMSIIQMLENGQNPPTPAQMSALLQ